MCLYTKQLTPKKTSKDITVYKRVRIVKTKIPIKVLYNGKIVEATALKFAPQTRSASKIRYEVGKTLKAIIQKKSDSLSSAINYGFHSFKNRKDAGTTSSYNAVIECVIPKGSYYYTGSNNGSTPGYVSDTLIVTKILN